MERETLQRKVILNILTNCYTHPTIKELYELVKEKYPNIGQATVYRTVNKLVLENTVVKIECFDGIHYDYNRYHYHFCCKNCHCITDVFLDSTDIDKLLSKTNLSNYKVNSIVFEGICDNCKEVKNVGVK